jgi:uncharacterized membrane protein
MKFKCEVQIDLTINKVIELFDDIDNLKEWQDGFISYEHISGKPGETGAISQLNYLSGKREIELIETILVKNLPLEMTSKYEHQHMVNLMTTRFHRLNKNKTLYEAEIEYTQFNGFMPKLMATLFPGMFKKQTQKWLNQFKDFAERTACNKNNNPQNRD